MQLLAYVTLNGDIPTRVMLDYAFDTGNVADLCSYAAAKCSCPLGCSFKASLKNPVDNVLWDFPDDVALKDGSEMHITISLPVNDYGSQLMSPARRNFSQSAPSTPGLSQNPMDNRSLSFDGSSPLPCSSSSNSCSFPTATATVITSGNPATSMNQLNTLATAPGSSNVSEPPPLNPSAHIAAVYYSQRDEVEQIYARMKPDETVFVNKVDVYSFLDQPVRKSGAYVMQTHRGRNAEVVAAAKFVCKKFLVELLVEAFPEYACSSDAITPATQFLAAATGNEWFNNLTTTNGSNLVINAFRQRNKRFREAKNLRNPSTATTPGKKKKLFEPIDPENLEAAAVALCRCSSFNETKKIVAQTAPLRCSWIKNMEQENALRIPETFMKKFPCFVGDISLLNEDYKCNMQHRGLDPVNFGEAFKNMIPAIFNLAKAKKVIPDDTIRPTDPDGEAWLACKLLILLVPKYCKKNTTSKPDRLFVEGWDSAYLNILHQRRREMKQTAPMIFVVTAHPSNTNLYYVATDDVALKVNGTFCDALQSLMELHYIFDLAYAKELKPFFLLLENMANLGLHRVYSTLNDLYYDLKMEAESINEASMRSPLSTQSPVASPTSPQFSETSPLPAQFSETSPPSTQPPGDITDDGADLLK